MAELYIPAVLGVRTTHGDAMFPAFDVITNCHEMCHCVLIRFAWEKRDLLCALYYIATTYDSVALKHTQLFYRCLFRSYSAMP